MTERNTSTIEHTETAPDVYLPAVAIPSGVGFFEDLVTGVFERHGVVPIPENYNQ